jgi:alpha-D-xyloside xylohydrolase
VPAPLDTLPLFIKAGGVVPLLRPTIQRMAPTTMPAVLDSFGDDAGVLYARLVPQPSATASFAVYDGASIAATPQGDGMAYTFKQGSVFKEGALLEAIHAPMPKSVTRAGAAFPMAASEAALETATSGWFWESAIGGRLWLKLGGDGQAVIAQ